MKENDSRYPTLQIFSQLSVSDKAMIFLSFPSNVQRLLIGCATFGGAVANPSMVKAVGRLEQDEFDNALLSLDNTELLTVTDNKRLKIAAPIKEFINTDLQRMWEEQRAAKGDDQTEESE